MIPVAGIAGFILAMVTIFKPTVAPWTSPVYAAMEGVFLGRSPRSWSMRLASSYGHRPPGRDADVGHTAGDAVRLRERDHSRHDRLKAGIVMATGAVCLFYFARSSCGCSAWQTFAFSSSIYGIGFSLFVVGLAAFNLLLDFDFIEEAAPQMPKYMEWYGAFG